MKKIIWSVALCGALILCASGAAMAETPSLSAPATQIVVIEFLGDEIVHDVANDVYFYPHLENMIGMTKDEQRAYMHQLNIDAYGGITDWHFANLEQMKGLMESMTGQTLIPGTVNHAFGINTQEYFPATDIAVTPMGPAPVTMGRTKDEWAKREDPATGPPWIPTVHDSIYGEGEYHWFELSPGHIIFDDDLNWIPDDALMGPAPHPPGTPPGPPIECSAWLVSETGIELSELLPNVTPMVPTVNHWGMVAMISLFAGLLVWTVRRRRLAA